MLHTYDCEKTIFHFDNGLEGDLIIYDKHTDESIRVSSEDIINLVAYEYVLPKRIENLENTESKDILVKY